MKCRSSKILPQTDRHKKISNQGTCSLVKALAELIADGGYSCQNDLCIQLTNREQARQHDQHHQHEVRHAAHGLEPAVQ